MRSPLYFISDVHLKLSSSDKEMARRKKLYSLLEHISETGGTVFFMGDLFDFYYEYPDVIPKSYYQLYTQISSLKEKGIDIHFLVGNHDYWVMDFITDELMSHTHLGDFNFEMNGKKFYLTHGDGILSWDYGYRFLKKMIRHPFFIWLFRWIHPTLGYKIGRFVSKSGSEYDTNQSTTEKVRNELIRYAETKSENGFDFILLGHYHLGEMIDLNQGKLALLGDWFKTPRYAVFDGEILKMKTWESS